MIKIGIWVVVDALLVVLLATTIIHIENSLPTGTPDWSVWAY